jgi:hypothetical protein
MAISFVKLFASGPIIIDHRAINAEIIPEEYITAAKNLYKIAYGHTSHGSQIITGLQMLARNGSIFQFNNGDGTLKIADDMFYGDLGNPNFTEWAEQTQEYLDAATDMPNIVMWSWCGELNDATAQNVNTYLSLMNNLEIAYPDIKFIYMTGHLNGTGLDGTLHHNNELIRQYCKTNNKILFDFADIESYDPSGNFYLDKYADDYCSYYIDGETEPRNWAEEWCALHPESCPDCYEFGGCAHSQCINCYCKGNAFWSLLATLAGWEGLTGVEDEDTTFNENEVFLWQNRPNPADEETYIKFYVPSKMSVVLELYDFRGSKAMTIINNVIYEKGENEVLVNMKGLNMGTYGIQLVANGSIKKNRMMQISR